jgi:hypothetical protein
LNQCSTFAGAVFVGAEKGGVQAVARVSEVLGVAAEEGGIEFGREDQADVRVFLYW